MNINIASINLGRSPNQVNSQSHMLWETGGGKGRENSFAIVVEMREKSAGLFLRECQFILASGLLLEFHIHFKAAHRTM